MKHTVYFCAEHVGVCAHVLEFDMNISYTMWDVGEGSGGMMCSAAAGVVEDFIFNFVYFVGPLKTRIIAAKNTRLRIIKTFPIVL